jgi:hypothetical protein
VSESGAMGEVTGLWKWIAAILAAILLAGLPGYIQLLRAPSTADFVLVRERQNDVLQRLAVIEQRLSDMDDRDASTDAQVRELQELIRSRR